MNTRKCDCGKKCFVFTNVSQGYMVFCCPGTPDPKGNKKLLIDEEFPSKFCNFLIKIPLEEPLRWPIITPQNKKGYAPPRDIANEIRLKVQFLRSHKKFSTLQELEQLSGMKYKDTYGGVYEWTQLIMESFTGQQEYQGLLEPE